MLLKYNGEISLKRILYTLCGAFEGGSNYWCERMDWHTLKDRHKELYKDCEPDDVPGIGANYIETMMYAWENNKPFSILFLSDGEYYKMTPLTIQQGVGFLSRDYPDLFHQILVDQDDATTSDALLQCILFGRVEFG